MVQILNSRALMKRLIDFVGGIGARAAEDDDSRLRRMVFIWASLAGVPSCALYAVLYTFFGAPLVG